MTTYRTGGVGDAGAAILLGLLAGLVFASLVGASGKAKPEAAKESKPAVVQQVKEPVKETPAPIKKSEPAPAVKAKEDCSFWRVMALSNTGKSMWAYYYTQWQACEGRNQ